MAKKQAEGSSDAERPKKRSGPRTSYPRPKTGESSDAQQFGSYAFATSEDAVLAQQISNGNPGEIMLAYEAGQVSLDHCAKIKIVWNAGNKGSKEELEHVRFSIKDSIVTRQQLDTMPVFTHKAAERIVDFCPDMMWRDMLLRIVAEAGFGNKEIRDRMCHNGNYVDKATITKRIGAALGQKQAQAATKKKQVAESSSTAETKPKEYANGDDAYYKANVVDFSNYMEFFGHKASHRIMLQADRESKKRKLGSAEREDSSGIDEVVSNPRKRKKENAGSVTSPLAVTSSDEMTGMEGGDESEAESEVGPDAVSVQSDTMLDQMDED